MKANHIPTTFDDKLMKLDNTIAKMGGMAEVQLADAIDALLKRDANKAAHVIEAECKIDILEAEIDESAIQMLASRQPMVEDLRVII
jgi:phosphate transport system protein